MSATTPPFRCTWASRRLSPRENTDRPAPAGRGLGGAAFPFPPGADAPPGGVFAWATPSDGLSLLLPQALPARTKARRVVVGRSVRFMQEKRTGRRALFQLIRSRERPRRRPPRALRWW